MDLVIENAVYKKRTTNECGVNILSIYSVKSNTLLRPSMNNACIMMIH